jgi:hypothetical protein
MHYLGVPSPKAISIPVVHSAQTVHLSCVKIKKYLHMDWNELSLDSRHLGVQSDASKTISEPMVRSAQTVHLCRIKVHTIPKQIEMSFHLIDVTLEYHLVRQNDFWAYGMFGAIVHLSCAKTNTISKQIETSFHFTYIT